MIFYETFLPRPRHPWLSIIFSTLRIHLTLILSTYPIKNHHFTQILSQAITIFPRQSSRVSNSIKSKNFSRQLMPISRKPPVTPSTLQPPMIRHDVFFDFKLPMCRSSTLVRANSSISTLSIITFQQYSIQYYSTVNNQENSSLRSVTDKNLIPVTRCNFTSSVVFPNKLSHPQTI